MKFGTYSKLIKIDHSNRIIVIYKNTVAFLLHKFLFVYLFGFFSSQLHFWFTLNKCLDPYLAHKNERKKGRRNEGRKEERGRKEATECFLYFMCFIVRFASETGSYCVAQDGLKLVILLPQFHSSWHYSLHYQVQPDRTFKCLEPIVSCYAFLLKRQKENPGFSKIDICQKVKTSQTSGMILGISRGPKATSEQHCLRIFCSVYGLQCQLSNRHGHSNCTGSREDQ